MKKFVYFVSFSYYKGKASDFGNARVTLKHPITTQEDIRDIENLIENNRPYKQVILLNFQLLREDE